MRKDGLTSHALRFFSAMMASPSPFCREHDSASLWSLEGKKWVCILYSLLGDGTWCLIRCTCFSSVIVVYDHCEADSPIKRVYHGPIVIDTKWEKGRFCMQKWDALHSHTDWMKWSPLHVFTVVGIIFLLITLCKDAALSLKSLSSFFSNRFDKLDSPYLFHFSHFRLIHN